MLLDIVAVADADVVFGAPRRERRPHHHGPRVDVGVRDDDALAVIGLDERRPRFDVLDRAFELA